MNQDASVVVVVFNRPAYTRRCLEAVREYRPRNLFVIADGPRSRNQADSMRCNEVRGIIERIDWVENLHTNFSETNLGLKRRISTGLDWVFSVTDRAVILEDDCIPDPTFFQFCNDLLHRYEEDGRVWVITGDNFQRGKRRGQASYYFSRYTHCWGWATWASRWQYYDGCLSFWPAWKDSAHWKSLLPDPIEREYWRGIFERVYRGTIDSWAYPWMASVWRHGGLTATPNANLVTNIGFGPGASHTTQRTRHGSVPTQPMPYIVHPEYVARDVGADRYTFDHHFNGWKMRSPWRELFGIRSAVKRRVNGILRRVSVRI